MSSDATTGRPQEGPHHFRAPDPADLVEHPVPVSDALQGPRPPRPWYALVLGQWPLFVTLLTVSTGLVVVWWHWKRGALIIGGGVVLGGILRLVLPEKAAGLLCCRSRWLDVLLTLATGLGIIVLALVISATRR